MSDSERLASPPVQYAMRDKYNLTIMDDPLYPSSQREQSAFNRSIANKTVDLKPGQNQAIIVFTENNIYYIEADGYMSGRIISVNNISDELKEAVNIGYREAKISDPVLQSIQYGQRNGTRSDVPTDYNGITRRDAEVDEKPYYREPRRSVKERLADIGIDITEDDKSQNSLRDLPEDAESIATKYFGTTTKWEETGYLKALGKGLMF